MFHQIAFTSWLILSTANSGVVCYGQMKYPHNFIQSNMLIPNSCGATAVYGMLQYQLLKNYNKRPVAKNSKWIYLVYAGLNGAALIQTTRSLQQANGR